MIKIAINGFGRIGKTFLRTLLADKEALKQIAPTVINVGPGTIEHTAYTFKYDTLMGTYPGTVSMDGNDIIIDGMRIHIIKQTDPSACNWKEFNIDWVVEATGKFVKRNLAQQHLNAGAHNVLITAPACHETECLIPGINLERYDKKNNIVSLGSCTTNAVVPMLQTLHKHFGIENAIFTTIHAYTNSQVLLDIEKKMYRQSRAAALNCIPSTTGAAESITHILPFLDGKIAGTAYRIPVGKVSIVDVVFTAQKPISIKAINQSFCHESKESLRGILDVSCEPLVSSDFNNNPYSVIIDADLTEARGNLGKVSGWYDNEWGYSSRLKDFLLHVAMQ
jgi:glyceraldehyde 3-phosphate dehydrogenase